MIERLFALFISVFALPAYVLGYSLIVSLALPFVFATMAIAGPIAYLFVALIDDELSAISIIFVIPLLIGGSIVAFFAFEIALIISTPFQILQFISLGLKNCYEQGFKGISFTINNNRTLANVYEEIFAEEYIAQLFGYGTPTINAQQLNTYEETTPLAIEHKLTAEQCEIIDKLLNKYEAVNNTLSDEHIYQASKLKVIYDNYKELAKRLDKVKIACENNTPRAIEDEVITLIDIDEPILLYKQYFVNNCWFSVPSTSRITDKQQLLTWLEKNATHPVNRDSMIKPDAYDAYPTCPTRYRWRTLSADHCWAQELNELADEIEQLSRTLSPVLIAPVLEPAHFDALFTPPVQSGIEFKPTPSSPSFSRCHIS